METSPVAAFTSEQLLAYNSVGGIPLHIDEEITKLVLETLIANDKGVHGHVSATLYLLAIHTVYKT